MTTPLRLYYATDYAADGNVYGYTVHNRETQNALADAGVEFDCAAAIAFHVASPKVFRAIPHKRNVLYVAWESDSLPADAVQQLRGADLIIVTAPFLKSVFADALPNTPVEVVPLAIDTDAFPYRERRIDRRQPFRFLWVGAPNIRKGYDRVLDAWRFFAHRNDVELYLKTTVSGSLSHTQNVTFDARNLPHDELLKLYHSAHAFVFPSYGEGFGLTLFEALSTGLPAIWTDWSAPHDYLPAGDSFGYPLSYNMVKTELGRMAQADLGALVRAMIRLKEHYPSGKAQRKARRAAKHVRHSFNWQRTAQKIINAIHQQLKAKSQQPLQGEK